MTDLDRIAALSTLAARCEMLGEKLIRDRVHIEHVVQLGLIQKAIDELLASYDPGEAAKD